MSHHEPDYIPYHVAPRVGGGRALVFAPHPDDEVFGCTGAILQHLADGDDVRVIVVTDGAFGVVDDGGIYAATRRAESRAAAKVLGYGEPMFWDYPDRGLVADEALVCRVVEAIEAWGGLLVYVPSWWEIHPDHTALSAAVTEAVRRANSRTQLVLYEVAVPLHANVLLDVTSVIDKKRTAMACFASQLAQQSYDQHVIALNRYRSYTLPFDVRYAEAYRRVDRTALEIRQPLPLMMRVDSGADPQAAVLGAPK